VRAPKKRWASGRRTDRNLIVADEFDNELDLDVLRSMPREEPPNCPVCDEPMMFNDGAWFCGDCNGTDCGPETG
jgi:hypothetical protein